MIDYQNPEVMLVAGALIKPALAAEASRYVEGSDFEDKRLARIWDTVIAMINEGLQESAIDAASVSRRFGASQETQHRIAMFLGELLDVPMGKSLVNLAQRIRRRSTMRVVRTEIEALHEELDSQIESNDGDIPNLDEKLAAISIDVTKKLDATQRRTTYRTYTKEIGNYFDDIAAFDSSKYIPTDIPKLDSRLGGGLRPGQLHAVLGGTGSGKTALASQLCDAAIKHGHRSIMFSMEVDPVDVYIRDVERKAGWSRWDLRNPSRKTAALADLVKAHAELVSQKNGKIVIAEPASLEMIRQTILTERLRGGPVRMIAVDHAQVALPSASEKRSMPRYLEVKGIAEGLRAIARQFNIAVVLTAQLNPPPKSLGKDGIVKTSEPSMDQIRESKDINNAAEVVMVIYHHFDEGQDGDREIIETTIKVEKIRAGVAGKVRMRYRGDIFRFEELYGEDKADSVAD